ncbi:hypothetical protein N7539_004238 [Penicillium diatomitis]|uniref:Uncharacterized protein n=1 Tax=Penicillium diatomitis TaxID=2819901 RepID=A0A9W9XE38_9EURO|nr:uncharacterized protein N7539_004238 [Penicillium diatomitis]KAJ5489348.1 hypothetical protein N7539_004238 [Penicillium diatomitis]
MIPLSMRFRAPRLHTQAVHARTCCLFKQCRTIHHVVSRLNRSITVERPNISTAAAYPRSWRPQAIGCSPPACFRLQEFSSNTPAKPTADLLIEELQDLYETAKDEFEIATESTDGSTIYAPSDRESARDALNQLCAVYHLYTARPGEDVDSGVRNTGSELEGDAGSIGDAVVETNFNPEDVSSEVRDEVRKRVGQRVRELRNAVELLEERAHAE